MREENKNPDYILLAVILILVVIGLIILSFASLDMSLQRFGNPYWYLYHQLFFGILPGIILGLIAFFLPLQFWKKISLPLLIFSILLLVLVFFPKFGFGYGGATRWLSLGPISFQPSELVKLSFIIYLGAWLVKRKEANEVKSFRESLIPFLTIVGVIGILLILQPDISTLGIICLTALAIYFVGGGRISHIILTIIAGAVLILGLIKFAPYRAERIVVYLNPKTDPLGIGYHLNQALIALGSGGIFGKGLGEGIQSSRLLPQAMGDSIFAIWGEEVGLIGTILVILLFTIFAWRGIRIAKNSSNFFGSMVAIGITSWITLQAFINIGAISGIIPLTGIPLPFISYGGSAIVVTLVGIGILLNISKSQ